MGAADLYPPRKLQQRRICASLLDVEAGRAVRYMDEQDYLWQRGRSSFAQVFTSETNLYAECREAGAVEDYVGQKVDEGAEARLRRRKLIRKALRRSKPRPRGGGTAR